MEQTTVNHQMLGNPNAHGKPVRSGIETKGCDSRAHVGMGQASEKTHRGEPFLLATNIPLKTVFGWLVGRCRFDGHVRNRRGGGVKIIKEII